MNVCIFFQNFSELNQATGGSKPKKKSNAKLKADKLNFINQMRIENQKSSQVLQQSWMSLLSKFQAQKSLVDSSYEALSSKINSLLIKKQQELNELKKSNLELQEKIERKQLIRSKLQTSNETKNIEISAEIDMELKLQQRAAELHRQLGDSQRRLESAKEQKIQLKKSYIRVINQYKRLKQLNEEREIKKEALQKKLYLQKKKIELEEQERLRIESENDPMNKYKSLLAAAGHIKFNSNPSDNDFRPTLEVAPLKNIYKSESSITRIYQPEGVLQNNIQKDPNVFVVDNVQNDEGVWLENNIRTLLSTGNYTDDDPVIRNLRAELARIRCY